MSSHVIDTYLTKIPQPQRKTLQALRASIHKVLPDAEEAIAYGMPAWIGKRGVGHLMEGGASRLAKGGECLAVVIRDLKGVVHELAEERGWPLRVAAVGDRHVVFGLSPMLAPDEDAGLYTRDVVTFCVDGEEINLQRPHDINEDPTHVKDGMPLLLECLPRTPQGSALCVRTGYGAVPTLLARRGALVTATDRDLLSTAFIRSNARRNIVHISTREAVWLPSALGEGERHELVVGELSASTGMEVAIHELAATRMALTPTGQALWLTLNKLYKQWVEPMKLDGGPVAAALASRGPYTVFRMTGKKEGPR